jgi:hypothetical protein
MQYLVELLPLMLRMSGDSEDAREQTAFAAWMAACGGPLRKVTAPMRLERKTLLVATTGETWRRQLRKMGGQLLFKVNSILGSPAVTAIEFVINERFVLARNSLWVPPPVVFNDPQSRAADLADNAAVISDPALREIFLRAAGKCLARRSPDQQSL